MVDLVPGAAMQPNEPAPFPALNTQIYAELVRVSAAILGSRADLHTLSPTGLAHQTLLRMHRQGQASEPDPERFRLTAATMAWREFLDYERARKSARRGGTHQRINFELFDASLPESPVHVIAVREALAELIEAFPDVGAVVLAKFFAGLTNHETMTQLQITQRELEEAWEFAKRYLTVALAPHSG